jgi:2-polyprenyl-3-methyl-5-hydroxy-6-metoxy-1,4-benzoquinol methylase
MPALMTPERQRLINWPEQEASKLHQVAAETVGSFQNLPLSQALAPAYVPETACRSCRHNELVTLISLGSTPLANSLLTKEQLVEPEAVFPLELGMCQHCSLVQITQTVPPELLFTNYLYFTSFSDTMVAHAQALSDELIASRSLAEQSLVVEIGSNDGYLLQFYDRKGIPVLGIEPAKNVAKVAQSKGLRTLTNFFSAALAEELASSGVQADVIHANNVLAHVADLHGMVEGIHMLLKPNGVALVEVPYLKDMIDGTEFDTIYHEHLCYYSLTALDKLFRAHNLYIVDVARLALHGGSLQLTLSKIDNARSSVANLLLSEREWGVNNLEFYRDFSKRVEYLGRRLRDLLQTIKAEGKSIAAYGASAKGSTLLNCFKIDHKLIDFIVDRSTWKQGFYSPGTHLEISDPKRLLIDRPDYVLLLTWNFADEIMKQQTDYMNGGGKFIIPIPRLRIM